MADVTDTFYPADTFIGYGAQFEVGQGGSPEEFVAVPQVKRISPVVSLTTAVKEVTHLRSPDATREKIPTLSDSSPITVEGTYRAGHGAHLLAGGDGFDADHNLQALRKSRALNNFRIVLPDAAGFETAGSPPEVSSPATAIALPLEGYVTKYEIGELSTENEVPFMIEITPARAYFSR